MTARFALNGPTMGTRWSAVFHAGEDVDGTEIDRELQSAVDRVDGQMSTWKPGSDLCRFNAAPTGVWIELPAELLLVVDASVAIGRASGGAFDIGVGDAVDAWGFGPPLDRPDPERIAALSPRPPAFEALVVDHAGRRMRKDAEIRLDLSAIAKGFGVDELARVLERRGIGSYLVAIDGELRGHGRKPGGAPWAVGVERPDPSARAAGSVLELCDAAVATSGNYRHRTSWQGWAVSHTIDPRTGGPTASRTASVTVLHRECMLADAWATVLMVLGEVDGPAFARDKGISALFAVETADGHSEIGTGTFA